jgi:hypothetical protein
VGVEPFEKKTLNSVLKFLASADYKNPWIYFLGKQVGGFLSVLKRGDKEKVKKKPTCCFFWVM